jgi:hypothetical protein
VSKALVYCSGPLANCTTFEAVAWRQECIALLGNQNCIDPSETWVREEADLSLAEKRKLVESDLRLIDQCKGLIYHCWKPSFGSPMELFYAHQNRKLTAVVSLKPLSPWVSAHADFVGTTVAEACRWLAIQLRIECPLLRRDQ